MPNKGEAFWFEDSPLYQSLNKILTSNISVKDKEVEIEKYILRIDEFWVDSFKSDISNKNIPSDIKLSNALITKIYQGYVIDFTLIIKD